MEVLIVLVAVLGLIALFRAAWKKSNDLTAKTSEARPTSDAPSPTRSKPPRAKLLEISAEIREAQQGGKSFWDVGPQIAEQYGLTIWDITEFELSEDKRKETEALRPRRVYRPLPESAFDLTSEDKVSHRIVGSSHWIEKDQLVAFNGTIFVLRREPRNKHDANAVAVFGGTRKFGHMSAAAAAKYAPLLDTLGKEFIVERVLSEDDRFYLPSIPKLRSIVEQGSSGAERD